MNKIIISAFMSLFVSALCQGQGTPHINFFPLQIHQQICPESTFTRSLQICNTGDAPLEYTAKFAPWGDVPPSTFKYCQTEGACDAFIERVVIGDIDTATGCSNGYDDLTSLVALAAIGEPTEITVYPGGNPQVNDECGIWIDWDQSRDFSSDEMVTLSGSPGIGPYTGTFIPPAGAKNGSTGMRILISRGAVPGPCGSSTVGEAEDYSVNVISWVYISPLAGTIQPGDSSEMQFNFNSAGLPVNNYYVNIHFSSNDTANPELDLLNMLHVQVLNIFINPEQDSICAGCSTLLKTSVLGCSEAYSFDWTSDPPGFTSNEMSPVVSPQVTTTYTVTVTDGNYSDQNSVLIKVYGSSSKIKENILVSDVSVYPNPCDEACLIKFNSEYSGEGIITINDFKGIKLQTDRVFINKGLNEFTLRTGNINRGAYLLSILGDGWSQRSALISAKIFIR